MRLRMRFMLSPLFARPPSAPVNDREAECSRDRTIGYGERRVRMRPRGFLVKDVRVAGLLSRKILELRNGSLEQWFEDGHRRRYKRGPLCVPVLRTYTVPNTFISSSDANRVRSWRVVDQVSTAFRPRLVTAKSRGSMLYVCKSALTCLIPFPHHHETLRYLLSGSVWSLPSTILCRASSPRVRVGGKGGMVFRHI